MKYMVNGKGKYNENYSTIIEAKSPQEAARLSVGNLLKIVENIMILNGYIPIKEWKMIDNKLVRTI